MAYLISLRNAQILIIGISVINFNQFALSSNPNLYTQKEIQALEKFRPLVKKHLVLDLHRNDAYLIGYLRRSDFDLSSAADSLQKIHQWRLKNNIDSILDPHEEIPMDLPYRVDGVDRDGRTVAILPIGKWNVRKYVIAGKVPVFQRQCLRVFEAAVRKTLESAERDGKDSNQIYILEDMQGFNARDHLCGGCIPAMVDMAYAFAIGVLPFAVNVTIVNTPRIAQPILRLGRAIVTGIPIRDFDSNKAIWQEAVFKDVSPDQLPKYLGGKRSK